MERSCGFFLRSENKFRIIQALLYQEFPDTYQNVLTRQNTTAYMFSTLNLIKFINKFMYCTIIV